MKDPIVQEGDPVLRQKAAPIPQKDIGSPKLAKLIARMRAALAKEEFGVALAAPQVGESIRLFIIAGRALQSDEDKEQGKPLPADMVFINPSLTRLSRAKMEMSEGCLSVRGKYGTVMRSQKASIRALNERGEAFVHHGTGLIGHIFQHECDHLDGILYIDKAVRLETDSDFKAARTKLETQ